MKTMLWALVCASTVSLIGFRVTTPAYAVLNPDDIIAIWFFDEGEGDTANDASGNPHDMDGSLEVAEWLHNAGEKPKWADGKFGKALKCEGAGSVIAVPNFIKD